MSEKDELLSKFTNKYNDLKNKEISDLNNKNRELQVKIQKGLERFNELMCLQKKIKEEEEEANISLNSLLRIVESRGIIFKIHNKNFQVKEWDHLNIEKVNNLYRIISKKGESLDTLASKYNDALDYIINNYSYSIVIIRMDSYSIKAQLRII
ncbi:hypothetical protein JMF89_06965 [Clostridiaceae bacterium UIB06]|uniref:Uncharacterized protein n=1 Tax=Clostridium thailandense TaxID=2794346 RepID=A0A949TL02_9CLOT|nr:hypothetical protein [Clostridium thailandense]MBV7272417.1 hypothetical protein [Clostridium thailandense]MCH5136941.1 hypothetical protein [Clostridiaceae bacterium UIB06]